MATRILKRRNFVAKALRTVSGSGAHEKTEKAKRRAEKVRLKRNLVEVSPTPNG